MSQSMLLAFVLASVLVSDPPDASIVADGFEWGAVRAVMAMTVVWIAPLSTACTVDTARAAELLNRHTRTEDQLQHLRVRAGPDGQLMIFAFLMADNRHQARATLLDVIKRTLTAEPDLRLWRII
jgi:hypothetical protein